ncbi:MAG: hypothetical protein FJY67_02460 [Calditrichaeota bacterium]|nr:hypothetical protein [Calditrichota bacterium]
MSKPIIGILALAFGIFATARSDAAWLSVAPIGNGRNAETLKVKENSLSYWRLGDKTPVQVMVTGPTSLKVITRSSLDKKSSHRTYGLNVSREDGKKYRLSRTTRYIKSVTNPKNAAERIGESRSITFKVPAGEHTYTFIAPKSGKNTVYARFFVANGTAKSPGEPLVSFKPVGTPEEVAILIKEEEYHYYRAGGGNGLELDVIGPTRINGLARLEFDHTMRGEKTFRVQVKEGAQLVQTTPFKSKPSAAASYKEKSVKVLSRGHSFKIDVPAGRHRYHISTPDPGVTVLFRFYIPRKSLGNELPEAKRNGSALLQGLFKTKAG